MKNHVFLVEFRRTINWRLCIAIIGVAFCICFDSWNSLINSFAADSGYVHYFFWNSGLGGVCRSYLLPVFTTLPFATSFCDEYNENIVPFIVSREGRKRYCITKYCANAAGGGIAAAIGIGLLFIVLAMVFPFIDINDPLYQNPELSEVFHSWLVTYYPLLYGVLEIMNGFLIGMLWASVALWTSAFIPNPFVTIASPYLASFILAHAYRLLRVDNKYRLDKWLTGSSIIESSFTTLIFSMAAVLFIVVLLGIFFTGKVQRRIENELHR